MNIIGRNAVREAILADKSIEKLYAHNKTNDKVFNDIIALAKQKNVKIQFVASEVLDRLVDVKNHQGLIAVAGTYNYYEVEDILNEAKNLNQPPFILILDEIADPHNFGNIIRTCDCLGVHGIIISKDRSCPVNETVVKVSVGATNYVKIAKVTNINREIEKLKQQNIWVYALELGGEEISKTNLTGPIAIVLGSEGKGVSKLTKELCDGVVTIAMSGKINSLNAGVACGISLYEISRQRSLTS